MNFIKSKYGQWAHPGENTLIPNADGRITMQGVDYPVLGIDDEGNRQMMMPGGEYQFPGNSVYEIPMAQYGINVSGPRAEQLPVDHEGMNAMMKARLAYEQMHGNPAATRMVAPTDNPYMFPSGARGTHFMSSYDNYAIPEIQSVNGVLQMTGPRNEEAMRFDRPEDANYFAAENYKRISPAFIEAELTDEEIKEYQKGGYIIEELSNYQEGGEEYGTKENPLNISQVTIKSGDKEKFTKEDKEFAKQIQFQNLVSTILKGNPNMSDKEFLEKYKRIPDYKRLGLGQLSNFLKDRQKLRQYSKDKRERIAAKQALWDSWKNPDGSLKYDDTSGWARVYKEEGLAEIDPQTSFGYGPNATYDGAEAKRIWDANPFTALLRGLWTGDSSYREEDLEKGDWVEQTKNLASATSMAPLSIFAPGATNLALRGLANPWVQRGLTLYGLSQTPRHAKGAYDAYQADDWKGVAKNALLLGTDLLPAAKFKNIVPSVRGTTNLVKNASLKELGKGTEYLGKFNPLRWKTGYNPQAISFNNPLLQRYVAPNINNLRAVGTGPATGNLITGAKDGLGAMYRLGKAFSIPIGANELWKMSGRGVENLSGRDFDKAGSRILDIYNPLPQFSFLQRYADNPLARYAIREGKDVIKAGLDFDSENWGKGVTRLIGTTLGNKSAGQYGTKLFGDKLQNLTEQYALPAVKDFFRIPGIDSPFQDLPVIRTDPDGRIIDSDIQTTEKVDEYQAPTQRVMAGNYGYEGDQFQLNNSNIHLQKGGGIDIELTDEEIEQYKSGGYIVEELESYQDGGVISEHGWDYKKEDGKYLTKRTGEEDWIVSSGDAEKAIQSRVFDEGPKRSPEEKETQHKTEWRDRVTRYVNDRGMSLDDLVKVGMGTRKGILREFPNLGGESSPKEKGSEKEGKYPKSSNIFEGIELPVSKAPSFDVDKIWKEVQGVDKNPFFDGFDKKKKLKEEKELTKEEKELEKEDDLKTWKKRQDERKQLPQGASLGNLIDLTLKMYRDEGMTREEHTEKMKAERNLGRGWTEEDIEAYNSWPGWTENTMEEKKLTKKEQKYPKQSNIFADNSPFAFTKMAADFKPRRLKLDSPAIRSSYDSSKSFEENWKDQFKPRGLQFDLRSEEEKERQKLIDQEVQKEMDLIEQRQKESAPVEEESEEFVNEFNLAESPWRDNLKQAYLQSNQEMFSPVYQTGPDVVPPFTEEEKAISKKLVTGTYEDDLFNRLENLNQQQPVQPQVQYDPITGQPMSQSSNPASRFRDLRTPNDIKQQELRDAETADYEVIGDVSEDVGLKQTFKSITKAIDEDIYTPIVENAGKLFDSPYTNVKQRDFSGYENWKDLKKHKDDINKMDQADLIAGYQAKNNPDKQYIVIDKKNARMHLYRGDKVIDTFEIGTGMQAGDEQTVTKQKFTDPKGNTVSAKDAFVKEMKNGQRVYKTLKAGYKSKVDWDAGNKQTGAGRYTIGNVSKYKDAPSFTLVNENGIEVPSVIHQTLKNREKYFGNKNLDDNRMSYGCINGLCSDLNKMKDEYNVSPGTEVFILPEEKENKFKFQDGNLIFKSPDANVNRSIATLNYVPIKLKFDAKTFKDQQFTASDTDDEKEYNETVLPFIKSLEDNKQEIMKTMQISGDTYNDIAKITFGIFGNETNFGDTHAAPGNLIRAGRKYLKKGSSSSPDYKSKYETYGIKGNNNSVGLTQFRWKWVEEDAKQGGNLKSKLKKLGITNNKDFMNPRKAAKATAAILSYYYNMRGMSPQNMYERLPGAWAGDGKGDRKTYRRNVIKNSQYLNVMQKKK